VRSKKDNNTYVIKKIKMEYNGAGNSTSGKEEQLMKKIRHRYIVKYIESFNKGDHLYLVMEYCEKGDLHQYLQRTGKGMQVPEVRIWKLFIQIC